MTDWTTGIMPLQQVNKPPFTVEVEGVEKKKGETIPRRHPKAKNGLVSRPHPEIGTVWDIVKRSARVYPNHNAIGFRKLKKLHVEKKKVQKNIDGQIKEVEKEWQYFELSPFDYITFTQYKQLVEELGSGLRKLGITHEKRFHIYGSTCANWIATSHACASQSVPIVTAYDTLGAEGLQHSLVQTQSEAMYIDPHLLKTAAGPLKESNVKILIVNEDCIFADADGKDIQQFKESNPEMKLITFKELQELGRENPVEPNPAKPEDIYCIMYTSGSTGLPKGACITHEALIAGITGLYHCVEETVSDKERVLAYLPLAHIFEMALENLVLAIGATLGYGNPKTLSDTSMKNSAGDMREFQPTVLVGVPQVWETVKKGVMAKLDSSSPILKGLFWGAFSYKSFMSRNNLPLASIFDGIVFSKVRELTGGRLRFIMNGASGISSGTKNFLSLVLAPMLAGYGLTETCANGSLGCPLEYTPDAIGPIPSSVEVKLVAKPDLGYTTDEGIAQGEIWIRGKAIMKEYFNNKEETEKAITSDGWFMTGDIGEFTKEGHLKVIDRVKNLVKMSGGEYIALEKLESVYRSTQTVANVIVHADPQHNRPIVLIMPNEKVLAEEAKKLGVDEANMHRDPKVNDLVLKDLQATAKRSGLTGIEIVAGVIITDEEWTPANGLLTATQKLNRKPIQEKFAKEIEQCLKKL